MQASSQPVEGAADWLQQSLCLLQMQLHSWCHEYFIHPSRASSPVLDVTCSAQQVPPAPTHPSPPANPNPSTPKHRCQVRCGPGRCKLGFIQPSGHRRRLVTQLPQPVSVTCSRRVAGMLQLEVWQRHARERKAIASAAIHVVVSHSWCWLRVSGRRARDRR
jgi:hypothetical protein